MAHEAVNKCSFCGGPPSGSGPANLIVHSKDGAAAVCGRCIESHAQLLRQTDDELRRKHGDT